MTEIGQGADHPQDPPHGSGGGTSTPPAFNRFWDRYYAIRSCLSVAYNEALRMESQARCESDYGDVIAAQAFRKRIENLYWDIFEFESRHGR
jgi:hypothetical protein